MRKSILLLFLLLIPLAFASVLYDEDSDAQANTKVGTGTCYNDASVYDSNYSTYGYVSGQSTYCYTVETYNKTANSLNATVQWKRENNNAPSCTESTVNLTIPDSCWNYNSTHLFINTTRRYLNSPNSYNLNIDCQNGSNSWVSLESFGLNDCSAFIFETAIYWEENNNPTLSNVQITNTPVEDERLDCSYVPGDADSDSVNVSITWFKQGTGNIGTYDYTKVNPTLGVNVTTGAGTGSLTGSTLKGEQYLCQLNITDGINNTLYNSSWATIDYAVTSNLSSYTQRINNDFYIDVNDSIGGSVTCSAYDNNVNVSCGHGVSEVLCEITGNIINSSVNITPYCYNSSEYYNGTSVNVTIDNIAPVITISNPNTDNSSEYYNVSVVNFDFNLADAGGIFGYNLTCYDGSTQEYSVQETSLSDTDIDKNLSTTFPNVGNKMCILLASDDHTAQLWKPDSIKKSSRSLNIDKGNIIIEYDDSSVLTLDSLDYISSNDRIMPQFSFKENTIFKDSKFSYTVKYKGEAYERNSEYAGHVVICPDNYLSNCYWFDAVDDDNTFESIVLDKNKKEIKYTHVIKTSDYKKSLTTKSLGGLNYWTESFNITVTEGQNITFNGYNSWNLSDVVYNISLSNGTSYEQSGELNLQLPCNININITSDTYMNNYSYNSVACNLSSKYNVSFYQAILNLFAYNNITNTSISSATYTLNDSSISNTSTATGNYTTYYINNDTSYSMNSTKTSYSSSPIYSNSFSYGSTTNITLNLSKTFNLEFRREETDDLFNFSETNETNYTVYLDIYCPTSKVRHTITEAQTNITDVDCNYDYWFVILQSSTDSYFRTIKPEFTDENITIYLLDLKVDTAIEMIFNLNDLVNAYTDGWLIAKKYINETMTEVIKQNFDIENKVIFWLDENEQYYIYAENDDGEVILLKQMVASAADSKSLILPGLPLYFEYDLNDIKYSFAADKDAGKAYLNFTDLTSVGFSNLTWIIYEYNTSTRVYNSTTLNGFNVSLTATGLLSNTSYSMLLYIDHNNDDYDAIFQRPLWFADRTSFPGFELYAQDIKLWVGMGVPLIILMIASVISIMWLFIISLILTAIFYTFGWYDPLNIPRLGLMIAVFALVAAYMLRRALKKQE